MRAAVVVLSVMACSVETVEEAYKRTLNTNDECSKVSESYIFSRSLPLLEASESGARLKI